MRPKTCPLFFYDRLYAALMQNTPEQSQLLTQLSFVFASILVNDRVSFQPEDNQRVIYVQGVIFAHSSRKDRYAEAYALVKLYESGYADQNDLARCFGYSTRSLRRYQQRLQPAVCAPWLAQEGVPPGTRRDLPRFRRAIARPCVSRRKT